jgi:hypothetical protein
MGKQTDSISNSVGASYVRDPYGYLVAMRVGDPTSSYYLTDAAGSVINLVSSVSGTTQSVASYDYCPTGNSAEPDQGIYAFVNAFRKYGWRYDWKYKTFWVNGIQIDANSFDVRSLLSSFTLGPTGYQFDWNLGSAADLAITSTEAGMNFFKAYPGLIFPFSLGQCSAITLDETCDLATPTPISDSPVQVSSIGPSSFTFTTLPGHFDPVGSTITFSLYQTSGDEYLQQQAVWASGGILAAEYGSAIGAFPIWEMQAARLQYYLTNPP